MFRCAQHNETVVDSSVKPTAFLGMTSFRFFANAQNDETTVDYHVGISSLLVMTRCLFPRSARNDGMMFIAASLRSSR